MHPYYHHHLNYKKKHTHSKRPKKKKKKKPISVGPPDHPSLPFAPFLVPNLIINLYATKITSVFLYFHSSYYFLSHRPILTCCIVYFMRDIKNISIYLSIADVLSAKLSEERKVTGSNSTRAKNIFSLFIAGLGRYMRQSTDTAGMALAVD